MYIRDFPDVHVCLRAEGPRDEGYELQKYQSPDPTSCYSNTII